MERLAELISKLKEQFEQKADSSKLLATTLLIERELMKQESAQPTAAAAAGSMISVVMPADRNGYHQRYSEALAEKEWQTPRSERERSTSGPDRGFPSASPFTPEPSPVGQAATRNISKNEETTIQEPYPGNPSGTGELFKNSGTGVSKSSENDEAVTNEFSGKSASSEKKEPAAKNPAPEFIFDPLTEIPTLSQQHSVKEINEMIGIRDASLNDKLKENKKEVGHILKEHPIRDLRKAIGVNDRYVFINELFRGDEVMYERSLKTINGFRIFAEAEYWIERELKVKLGWEEHKDATRVFYDLIRRRFS